MPELCDRDNLFHVYGVEHQHHLESAAYEPYVQLFQAVAAELFLSLRESKFAFFAASVVFPLLNVAEAFVHVARLFQFSCSFLFPTLLKTKLSLAVMRLLFLVYLNYALYNKLRKVHFVMGPCC